MLFLRPASFEIISLSAWYQTHAETYWISVWLTKPNKWNKNYWNCILFPTLHCNLIKVKFGTCLILHNAFTTIKVCMCAASFLKVPIERSICTLRYMYHIPQFQRPSAKFIYFLYIKAPFYMNQSWDLLPAFVYINTHIRHRFLTMCW